MGTLECRCRRVLEDPGAPGQDEQHMRKELRAASLPAETKGATVRVGPYYGWTWGST